MARLKSQLIDAKGKSKFPRLGPQDRDCGDEEEAYEEGQEVEEEEQCEGTPEEEEVKVEWPTGVAQASEKDLAKLSNKQGVQICSTAIFCLFLHVSGGRQENQIHV